MGESIFISYRREDTAGFARALYNALLAHFGPSQIFMDVATIEAGVDFVRAIDEAVDSCLVMVALIGRRWLSPRLAEQTDYVRIDCCGTTPGHPSDPSVCRRFSNAEG